MLIENISLSTPGKIELINLFCFFCQYSFVWEGTCIFTLTFNCRKFYIVFLCVSIGIPDQVPGKDSGLGGG